MSVSLPPIPNILRATLPGLTRFCNTRISQLVVLDYKPPPLLEKV